MEFFLFVLRKQYFYLNRFSERIGVHAEHWLIFNTAEYIVGYKHLF